MELRADLCIVGAGYAGVCAYDAACQYLEPGARVIVVDPNAGWGGQWIHQYDFVRLHQPFQIFTAGSRDWAIKQSKPPDYLANKTEILSHLRDCVRAATTESRVELVELFGFRYTGHASASGLVEVQVVACCLESAETGTRRSPVVPKSLTIRSDRLIKAIGLDVMVKRPLALSSCSVNSISPKDVLAPHWKAAVRFSDRPIFVVGSGKTAMDVINHFVESGLSVGPSGPRIHCIAGRGTWYIKRDVAFPVGSDWGSFMTRHFLGETVLEYFSEMIAMHDGTNEKEVYAAMGRKGFFHSPVPEPENFSLGILSVAEADSVREALGDRVIKARLMDVIDSDDGSGPLLRLRSNDRQRVFDHIIPPGSFVINCTDSLFHADKINNFEPVLSEDGLVCSPQTAFGFTGPGADICTHAFYLGTLEKFWRELPRGELDPANKHKGGILLIYALVVNNFLAARHLPPSIMRTRKHSPTSILPKHRVLLNLARITWNFGRWHAKAKKLQPGRYTDDAPILSTERFVELDKEGAAAFGSSRL